MVENWTDEGVQTVAIEEGKTEAVAEGLEPTSTYEFKLVGSDGESPVATYDTQVCSPHVHPSAVDVFMHAILVLNRVRDGLRGLKVCFLSHSVRDLRVFFSLN
jgi:hypothetical protein